MCLRTLLESNLEMRIYARIGPSQKTFNRTGVRNRPIIQWHRSLPEAQQLLMWIYLTPH